MYKIMPCIGYINVVLINIYMYLQSTLHPTIDIWKEIFLTNNYNVSYCSDFARHWSSNKLRMKRMKDKTRLGRRIRILQTFGQV